MDAETINGFGTSLCGYAASVRWEKSGSLTERGDHDAVMSFVICFLPIVPFRPVHTFDWSGNCYKSVRIRMTAYLLIRALLRPYLLALIGVSLFLIVMGLTGVPLADKLIKAATCLWAGGIGLTVGLALMSLLGMRNRRDRDIRLLLGRHALGSSDPAMWMPDLVAQLDAASPFKGERFSLSDVRDLLQQERIAEAMWLARWAAAKAEPWAEQATTEILDAQSVQTKLAVLRKAPWKREEILSPAQSQWWPMYRGGVMVVNSSASVS